MSSARAELQASAPRTRSGKSPLRSLAASSQNASQTFHSSHAAFANSGVLSPLRTRSASPSSSRKGGAPKPAKRRFNFESSFSAVPTELFSRKAQSVLSVYNLNRPLVKTKTVGDVPSSSIDKAHPPQRFGFATAGAAGGRRRRRRKSAWPGAATSKEGRASGNGSGSGSGIGSGSGTSGIESASGSGSGSGTSGSGRSMRESRHPYDMTEQDLVLDDPNISSSDEDSYQSSSSGGARDHGTDSDDDGVGGGVLAVRGGPATPYSPANSPALHNTLQEWRQAIDESTAFTPESASGLLTHHPIQSLQTSPKNMLLDQANMFIEQRREATIGNDNQSDPSSAQGVLPRGEVLTETRDLPVTTLAIREPGSPSDNFEAAVVEIDALNLGRDKDSAALLQAGEFANQEGSDSSNDGEDDLVADEFSQLHVVAAHHAATKAALHRHIGNRMKLTLQQQQLKQMGGPSAARGPLTRTAIAKEREADEAAVAAAAGNVLSQGGCGVFAVIFTPTGHVALGSTWDFHVSRAQALSLLRAGQYPHQGLQGAVTRFIAENCDQGVQTPKVTRDSRSDQQLEGTSESAPSAQPSRPFAVPTNADSVSIVQVDESGLHRAALGTATTARFSYSTASLLVTHTNSIIMPKVSSPSHEVLWDELGLQNLVKFKILQQFPAAGGNAVPLQHFEELLERRLAAHTERFKRQRLSQILRSRNRREILPRWGGWVHRTRMLRAIERRQATNFVQRFVRGCIARALAARLRRRNRIIHAANVISRAAAGFLSRKVIRMRRFGKILHLATQNIRRLVRGHLARRRVVRLRSRIAAAVRIQASWRAHLAWKLVFVQGRRIRAAKRLQLFYHRIHAQAVAARRKAADAAKIVQAAIRRRQAQRALAHLKQLQAILKLQNRVRMRIARHERERRVALRAALRLQAIARVRQARKRAARQREYNAASTIAATVRRGLARKGYRFIAAQVYMFAARIQKNRRTYVHRMWLRVFNAASKIQSLYRTRAAMKRIAELKRFGMKNCVPIQAWWRGEMARERVRSIRRRAAAGILQRTLRMFNARLLAFRLREQVAKLHALRTKSAGQVQRVYRGLKGRLYAMRRRRLAELALLRAKRETAALRIQTNFRASRGRLALHMLRRARDDWLKRQFESARVVQNTFRAKKARDALRKRKQNDAARRLQTWWRAKHGRLAYMMIRRGARVGQRVYRQSMARKALNELRRQRAALLIQTRYRCHRGQLAKLLLLRAKRQREVLMERNALKVQRRVRIFNARRERARRAQELQRRHDMARRIQARFRAHRGQLSYFLQTAAIRENRKAVTRVAIWVQARFRRNRAKRYSDQQAKRATVLHKRDRERRAAVRVQSRWRGRKGRLAYHLIQQAKKLQQEEDETDYDPANWIRGWDEEAKLHYYINIKTGRSQWDRPNGFVGYSADGVWAECEDQSTGYLYYYNYMDGSTQWEKPENFDAVVEGDWQQFWDGEHKTFYYFNAKTEETTWEKPPDFELADTTLSGVVGQASAQSASDAADDPLLEQWIRYWDSDSQSYYFYNTGTGEASHEEPESWTDAEETVEPGVSDVDPAVAKTSAEQPDAPSGGSDWSMEWDDTSQSYYYYNAATEEVSYDPPDGFDADAAMVSKGAGPADASNEWTEHWDDDAGQAYFYNATTDETTWEDPRDPAAIKRSDESSPVQAGVQQWQGTATPFSSTHESSDDVAQQSAFSNTDSFAYDDTDGYGAAQSNVGEYAAPADHHAQWVQHWDDESQAYYYEDAISQEVVWDEPATYTPYSDTTSSPTVDLNVKHCANCSKKLRAAANFCRFCGNACK